MMFKGQVDGCAEHTNVRTGGQSRGSHAYVSLFNQVHERSQRQTLMQVHAASAATSM